MPTINDKRIKRSDDLRIILSRAINLLLRDELSHSTASALSSLSNTMLKVLKAAELEERITKLEDLQDSKSSSSVTSDIKQMIGQMRN